VVVTYHGDDILGTVDEGGRQRWFSAPVVAAGRLLADVVDAVIVQSAAMAARLRRADVHVIPHEVDFEVFRPTDRDDARRLLGLAAERRYVLFASPPHIAVKRYPLAQAAVERLRDVELLVVHNEPQDRLALYMSACDALVFPSFQEGSPNIVKQAMACNLPIVATDVGDVRDVIDGTPWCFVSEPDAAAFAARLGEIVSVRARTDGRERIGHLGCETVARRVVGVYERVLERAPARATVGSAEG
jgi:glycosyltransferase involved in cell wall biosynthesis